MSAADDVLEFSQTRDPWQQDLIRRIFTRAELTDEDLRDGLSMLRHQFGLPSDRSVDPVPLAASHIPGEGSDRSRVVINSLANLVNANRLATGQTLSFALQGVTVIYGDNGSGKSGYCRVLKKLCRVREGAEEEIRGNLFEPASAYGTAEATVRFTVGDGELVEERWRNGTTPPASLARVSVFDAVSAALYADQQNRIEFLPRSLDVMTRLGAACETLGRQIDGERANLDQRLAVRAVEVPPGTPAATLLDRLGRGRLAQDLPTPQEITEACGWSEAYAAELEDIERELTGDPAVAAAKLRRIAKASQQLEEEIAGAQTALSPEAVDRYREMWTTARDSRSAASMAASVVESGDLLPGFGSDPWRRLFTQARAYSALAYPGHAFPVTSDGARCVLCQQELDPEGAARLRRFDQHVQGAAEAAAVTAERDRDGVQAAIERLRLPSVTEAAAVVAGMVDDDSDAATLIEEVSQRLSRLADTRQAVLASFDSGDWIAFAPQSAPSLAEARRRLDRRIQDHEAAADPAKRALLERRAADLRGRRALSAAREALLARRVDLDTVSRLNACRQACDTNAISRKNSELRKRYLTKEFEEKLLGEVASMDLAHLPFRIQDRSERGASYLGIGLEAAAKVRNREVLSGGEFRALAIACFLAEVNSIPGHDGIIIDDPVSSLDSVRTRRVARRLVQEARQGRQVVVFTHDLVFFHELRFAAAEQLVPLLSHWIRRTQEFGYGTVFQNEEPWGAKKVRTRLGDLEQRLAAIRKVADVTGDTYRDRVKAFYTDLRETWERLVEELLLGGVIGRFQLGVETQSLKGVRVEDEDYRRVFFGMKRASEFSAHDRAAGVQATLPNKDEIAEDLAVLRTYSEELKKRSEKLADERKKLEKPPPAKTR